MQNTSSPCPIKVASCNCSRLYSQADKFSYRIPTETLFIIPFCNLDCCQTSDSPQLYRYKDAAEETIDARFYGRLGWNGSNNTKDLQDGSIYINTVTFNDTGTYMCMFNRTLVYPNYKFETSINKSFILNVVPQSKIRREPLTSAQIMSFESDLNNCIYTIYVCVW